MYIDYENCAFGNTMNFKRRIDVRVNKLDPMDK